MADVLNGSPARPVDRPVHLGAGAAGERADHHASSGTRSRWPRPNSRRRPSTPASVWDCSAAAGVLALYGVGALIATLIIVLDLFLPLWLAALIVTVVLFLVAGILALLGKKQVTKAVPPEPQAAIASVKADVDEVKHAVKDRSRAEHRMSDRNGAARGEAGRGGAARRDHADPRRSRRDGAGPGGQGGRQGPRQGTGRADQDQGPGAGGRGRREGARRGVPGHRQGAHRRVPGHRQGQGHGRAGHRQGQGTAVQASDKVKESGALDRADQARQQVRDNPVPFAAVLAGMVAVVGVILIVRGRRRVSPKLQKVAYKPVGLLLGIGAGAVAGLRLQGGLEAGLRRRRRTERHRRGPRLGRDPRRRRAAGRDLRGGKGARRSGRRGRRTRN